MRQPPYPCVRTIVRAFSLAGASIVDSVVAFVQCNTSETGTCSRRLGLWLGVMRIAQSSSDYKRHVRRQLDWCANQAVVVQRSNV